MTTNFSTEFPIDPAKSVSDVVRLACDWVSGSPHTKILKSDLDELPSDAEKTVSSASEQVTTAIANGQNFDIGGLRYDVLHPRRVPSEHRLELCYKVVLELNAS